MKLNAIEQMLDKKQVKAFKKEIKKWLKPIKKNIKVEMAMSYECVITKPKIYVDIVRDLKLDNECDILHKEIYQESNYQFMKYLNYYTFAFLHELGHIMTVKPKDFEDEENQYYEELEMAILEHIQEENEVPNLKMTVKYHMNTTLEKLANDWAYTFWKNNKDYCKKLENILIRYSIKSI